MGCSSQKLSDSENQQVHDHLLGTCGSLEVPNLQLDDLLAILTTWVILLYQVLDDQTGRLHIFLQKGNLWNVFTLCFLSFRFLGLLRGTNKQMATFILMLQEISWKIDTFLVVLTLILIMFAMLYHVLLFDEDLDDGQEQEWSSFGFSLWKLWGFSLGHLDDSAFPNYTGSNHNHDEHSDCDS